MAQAITDLPEGGSSLELLEEITLTEAVRAVNFDTSQWSDYDFLICFCNVTLSSPDWIYVTENSTTGGGYTAAVPSYQTMLWAWVRNLNGANTAKFLRVGAGGAVNSPNVSVLSNVYVYLYDSNKTFNIGSKFKVYGIKYEDL